MDKQERGAEAERAAVRAEAATGAGPRDATRREGNVAASLRQRGREIPLSIDSRQQQGAAAERDAAELLIAEGYEIVERNFRCKAGELDLIARDGDVLVFVEVRSRSDQDHGHAVEMIGRAKQRQVVRVARHYLEIARPRFERCRFDVVAVTAGAPILLRDAFRA